MAGINRIGSPMDICDEGFDEAPGTVERRKRDLENKQQSKSRILLAWCYIVCSCSESLVTIGALGSPSLRLSILLLLYSDRLHHSQNWDTINRQ